MSLWGGLTLQRAVVAARVNDPDTAYGQLERAKQMAGRLGEGRNDYNTELSAERQGRLLVEMARAHAQRRQDREAVTALLQAEQITPELVRGHVLVRQLVTDLLTMQDPPGAELRDLARRLTARTETGT